MTQQFILTQDGNIDESQNDYRKLNENEIIELFDINPQINIDEIIVLDSGYLNAEDYEDYENTICESLDCLELEGTKVYDSISGNEIKQLSLDINSGRKEQDSICFNESITCYKESQIAAMYNCLGWAIGISKWLSTSVIDNYIKEGATKAEAVEKFIAFYHEKFPYTHPANFEQFSDKLNILSSKPEVITNNTIIFYFKGDHATHAARYIEDLGDDQPINKWTSKMGPEILIAHQELEDLAPNFFGTEFVYVAVELS